MASGTKIKPSKIKIIRLAIAFNTGLCYTLYARNSKRIFLNGCKAFMEIV